MHRSKTGLLTASFLLTAWTASTALATDPVPLTSCGQEVDGPVYLEADLDCTGQSGHGVRLNGHGRLELRGFTLSNATLDGVECSRGCRIIGPGSIVGSAGEGVRAPYKMNRITDVTISGSGSNGITIGGGRIDNSTIESNGYTGINVGWSVKLNGTTVSGNQRDGIDGPNPDFCRKNALKLRASTVTGNGLSPVCDTEGCADIRSCAKPALDETSTCETSIDIAAPGADWDVCSLD